MGSGREGVAAVRIVRTLAPAYWSPDPPSDWPSMTESPSMSQITHPEKTFSMSYCTRYRFPLQPTPSTDPLDFHRELCREKPPSRLQPSSHVIAAHRWGRAVASTRHESPQSPPE